jgi:hypothetical protein
VSAPLTHAPPLIAGRTFSSLYFAPLFIVSLSRPDPLGPVKPLLLCPVRRYSATLFSRSFRFIPIVCDQPWPSFSSMSLHFFVPCSCLLLIPFFSFIRGTCVLSAPHPPFYYSHSFDLYSRSLTNCNTRTKRNPKKIGARRWCRAVETDSDAAHRRRSRSHLVSVYTSLTLEYTFSRWH